jgi:alpha-D-xyloside xylohydrolase
VFEVRDDAVVWRGDGETLQVQSWGPDSVRVRSRLMGEVLDTDYALLPPESAEISVDVDGDVAVLRNGGI